MVLANIYVLLSPTLILIQYPCGINDLAMASQWPFNIFNDNGRVGQSTENRWCRASWRRRNSSDVSSAVIVAWRLGQPTRRVAQTQKLHDEDAAHLDVWCSLKQWSLPDGSILTLNERNWSGLQQLNIIKGSLVRKLPSYERFWQPAVAPSCQPHHHLNHIIIK